MSGATPLILAPAGSRASFLAALAAGADAVYAGLKLFSARMEAANFSIEELAGLTDLAHARGTKVFVAINTLVKPDELALAAGLVGQLQANVGPDALIVQDLALIDIARQAGFAGQIHLSTLANVTFPAALTWIGREKRADCVVLPRELSIDEIRQMAATCPANLGLEVFVHGALCYGVSGRCYWSSMMGGKSGLRGRCVQPCRRRYRQGHDASSPFACMDLGLDVLVKVLAEIPQITGWKIEGRKKGPHYVFYTAAAYKLLRDQGRDPQAKKDALGLLERALGRQTTHYGFLPQRPQSPVQSGRPSASGLMIGTAKGAPVQVRPREQLLDGDLLRVGFEDDPWHTLVRVKRSVPAGGRLTLKVDKAPATGAPVFLIDRRESALAKMIEELEKQVKPAGDEARPILEAKLRFPRAVASKGRPMDLPVYRQPGKSRAERTGIWLSRQALDQVNAGDHGRIWWWLPPVVWPTDQAELKSLIDGAMAGGARRFVLNAPWQAALFDGAKGMWLWAGPFCNIANPLALDQLRQIGFCGAIVSPELGKADLAALGRSSPLALGIVIYGDYPLCVSRIKPGQLEMEKIFTSPKGESAWMRACGPDVWVFPGWRLDLRPFKAELAAMGFGLFVSLLEPLPAGLSLHNRPGPWNWDIGLK